MHVQPPGWGLLFAARSVLVACIGGLVFLMYVYLQ